MAGSDATATIIAFYQSNLNNTKRPQFSTKKDKDGRVTVTPTSKPTEVKLWQAINPKDRDFRVDVIGSAYTATSLAASKNGTYSANVTKPATGFTAWFIELTFSGDFKLTTEVSISPDMLPHQ